MRFLALFLLIPSIIQVYGHIRLVFPAPRQPALDSNFVQNSKLPCGVPKPGVAQGHRTFLQAGTMIEIEWDSAAPHAGGIRLEVLNALDEPIALFVNFNEAFNVSETTRTVELPPKFECANCAIRLTQAMSELSPESQFVSCGDVNILNAIPDGDSCLGHGTRQNGKCKCDKNFIGDQCHREVECMTSSDCGPSAECRTSLLEPTRQCFCPQGAFGETCQLESSIDLSRPINESLYQKREDQGNEILWRIINDEIEMVLRYPGNSWVAVGWKPQDYQCFDMASGLTSNAEEQATKDILTNVQTSANASVVNTAVSSESSDKGDDCAVNEFWSECPEMSRECEASCDWTKYPETIPNCPRTCAPPRCVCKEGYVRKSNDDMTCVPFSFCDKEAEPHCGANMTWAKCGTACEPSCSNMYDTAPCPATCEKPACTCADNYVRLNGQCIYWGDCPQVEHHIKEENAERTAKPKTNGITKSTVASSTKAPQGQAKKIVPKQCPINETFNECGRICEADCVTVFTRTECDGCGAADCSCIQGYARNSQGQCVYWGDCPVEGTGLETRPPTTTSTTKPSATTNPPLKVNGDVCYGDWRFPPGCKDCQYKLSWNYVEDNDTVEFSLETRVSGNSWTGVGISPQGTMVDSDMLLIKSENGKLTVEDSYSEGYGRPIKDAVQNVEQNVVGTHANGILRAQFSRPRNTKDTQDKQLDNECHYFLFPVEGGKLDNSGNITAHTTLPMVSDRKICIRSCANNKETAKETVTSPVTQKSAEKSEASSAKCENSYRYPEGCQEDKCEYEAKWDYNTKRGDVRFEIRSKNVGRWTGIGFSKTGEMANSDVYTGWVYEGKAYVTDRFSYGRQLPAIDPQDRQDAYNVSGKIENDIQILTFHRKLKTLDTTTDYPLDKCYYFLFPIGGGRVLARKSSDFAIAKTPIGYHDLYEPKSSPKKICLCDENGVVIGKDDAVPTRVRVRRQAQQAQGKLPLKDAMSCTDMTVAFVEDSRVRIRDFYSPSQASPVPDQKLGGSDSLTDAAGMQKDGVTTIIFRKKLQASDKFDHTIVNAPMSVIWAKGADSRNYVHMIPNGEDKEFTFFQPGVFRYHGKNKRGVMTINFLDDHSVPKGETVHGMQVGVSTCKGRFSMPEGCSGSECTYFVEWNSDGQVARFTVMSKLEVNKWTAVGFSHDGSMAASDVIVIGVQNDVEKSSEMQVTVTDQFMPGYGRPTVDEQQDIFDVETSFVDGILNANFSRELHSDDNNDVDLKECVYLLYTPHGGRIETNGEIRKHGETPLASKTKICLDTCKEVKEETQPHSVPIPTVPIEVPPTPRIHETTIEKTRPTTVTVPKTQYTHQVQTQGTHEDTHFTQPPAIPTTQYTTQRPRIQETDKKGPSQSDPHIAVVYVPDETEQVRGKYGLRVRILNREFTDALKDSNSEYHQSLTKEVVAAINRLLHDKWKGVQVSKILEYSKGSVIADVEVVSTRDTPRPIEIKSQIEENAIRGAVNGLRIEPSTVKANLIEDEPRIEHAMVDPSFTRNIIIISVCVLLLALTILCCCCLLCRVRRTSHRFDSYPIPHPTGMHPYGNFGAPQNGKGKSFENAAFAMRHSSQTTASSKHGDSPNLNGTSSNGNGHQANGNGNHHANGTVEKAPDGIGETTYKEWFDKVGSKPASQHVEESLVSPRGPPNTSLHPSQPYVSYPNDPSGYYTLGDVRFDCYPDGGASQQNCEARGCVWQPVDHDKDPIEPWCYFKSGVGYKYDSSNGNTINLKKNDGPKNPWGDDFPAIQLTTSSLGKTLNIKITTAAQRYEPPVGFPKENSVSSDSLSFNSNTQTDPFSFTVTRSSNGETLFDTSIGGLIFSDKFIQIATYLPSENMYGWGENIHQTLKHDFSKYQIWGMFARDEPPNSGSLDTKNLYGVHPFYLCLEPSGKAHGVLILNSNAQEVMTTPGPAVIYRTIGGNLDMYFFPGPTPEEVIQQYQNLIGRPFLPAYWAFGFQLSRYGYKSLDEMKEKIGNVRNAGIPIETGVSDIDYMQRYKDFTLGDNWKGFGDYVNQLHQWNMKLVPIFDPAIEADYDSFQRGVSSGAKFVEWERADQVMQDIQKLYPMANGTKIMLGVVWPDNHVGFPDFLDETGKTQTWWTNEFKTFHDQVGFDGIWIDMNEPSNFGTNDDHPWYYDNPDHPNDLPLKCPTSGADATWDMPPYQTHSVYYFPQPATLASKTLCMLAVQNNGKYRFYDVKNLYGLTEASATQQALFAATGKRGTVISRSTFPSAGRFTGHWLGDNTARWEDLRTSIIGAQEFNLFGIPYVGSDICGFIGATNEELCLRWQQMGAWHSFMRNHNDNGSPPQDPAEWPSVAAATKQANLFRYLNLPYLFSLHFAASMNGGTVVRPVFFEFPQDTVAQTLSYQFMWGSALIIAPVINPGTTQMDVYLPAGSWYSLFDYNYGQKFTAGYQRNVPTPTTSLIPVFIRGGYIIPQQGANMTTTDSRKNPYQLTIAPDDNMQASGFLYWDDGETIVKSFQNHPYHNWKFTYKGGSSNSLQIDHPTVAGTVQVKTLDTITIFNSPAPDFDSFTLNSNKVQINQQTSSYSAITKILTISTTNLIPINNPMSYTLTWKNLPTSKEHLNTNRIPDAA